MAASYVEDHNCSGNAKVIGLGNSKENALEWNNVESENGGLYQISIKYLCEGTKEMTVEVNEKVVKTAKVSVEEGAKVGTLTFTTELAKGNNTIRLSNATGDMLILKAIFSKALLTINIFGEVKHRAIREAIIVLLLLIRETKAD